MNRAGESGQWQVLDVPFIHPHQSKYGKMDDRDKLTIIMIMILVIIYTYTHIEGLPF